MDRDRASRDFASALQEALTRRGLPLARVQARLGAAGHAVAMSTISQWQRGHRLPRSDRSLAVVDALETVLEVPPGTLRVLAEAASPEDTRTGARPVVSYHETFGSLVEQMRVSSYGSLATLGAHDELLIGEHGSLLRRRSTMTMKALAPVDRHVVSHGVDDGGDVELVTFSARRGCRLGRVVRDTDEGVAVAELHFDRTLTPGETVVLEVEVTDGNDLGSTGYYRWTTQEIPLLVVEATFDRRLVPTTVMAFDRATSDGPDQNLVELPIDRGDRVHVVRQPAAPGVHGIRWTWPDR